MPLVLAPGGGGLCLVPAPDTNASPSTQLWRRWRRTWTGSNSLRVCQRECSVTSPSIPLRAPYSASFNPWNGCVHLQVARCQTLEAPLVLQPLIAPLTSHKHKSSKDMTSASTAALGTETSHQRINASLMIHDLLAGGTTVLHTW